MFSRACHRVAVACFPALVTLWLLHVFPRLSPSGCCMFSRASHRVAVACFPALLTEWLLHVFPRLSPCGCCMFSRACHLVAVACFPALLTEWLLHVFPRFSPCFPALGTGWQLYVFPRSALVHRLVVAYFPASRTGSMFSSAYQLHVLDSSADLCTEFVGFCCDCDCF